MEVNVYSNNIDNTFNEILQRIINTGYTYADPYRKGVERMEIAQFTLRHDLQHSFPAIQSKKLFFQTVQQELFWFLSGSTNLKDLWKRNVHIWDEDGYKFYTKKSEECGYKVLGMQEWKALILSDINIKEIAQPFADGDLGKIYPAQWRNSGGVDQINNLIHGMKTRPMATDLIVSAWSPSEMKNMALPPCHYGFQMLGRPVTSWERAVHYIKNNEEEGRSELSKHIYDEERLDKFLNINKVPKVGFTLEWQQRSVDTFLGLPFNIASYALACEMLCDMTNNIPLGIIGNLKKVHLYSNALAEVKDMLAQTGEYKSAKLVKPKASMFTDNVDSVLTFIDRHKFKYTLDNYKPGKARKVKMLSRDV